MNNYSNYVIFGTRYDLDNEIGIGLGSSHVIQTSYKSRKKHLESANRMKKWYSPINVYVTSHYEFFRSGKTDEQIIKNAQKLI